MCVCVYVQYKKPSLKICYVGLEKRANNLALCSDLTYFPRLSKWVCSTSFLLWLSIMQLYYQFVFFLLVLKVVTQSFGHTKHSSITKLLNQTLFCFFLCWYPHTRCDGDFRAHWTPHILSLWNLKWNPSIFCWMDVWMWSCSLHMLILSRCHITSLVLFLIWLMTELPNI